MRILNVYLVIILGAIFASVTANGSTEVVKKNEIFYFYECGESATSNQPQLITKGLAKQAHDSGVSTTNFRPTGFAGITRVKSNIYYQELENNKYFLNVVDTEQRTNVLMLLVLILFSVIILLCAIRVIKAVEPGKFIFLYYFLIGVVSVFTISLIALWLTNGFGGKSLPESAIIAILAVILMLAITSGIILANIFKKSPANIIPEKRVEKMMLSYFGIIIILFILGVIYGGFKGLFGMLIIGISIYLPIIGIKQLTKFLKKPRKRKG